MNINEFIEKVKEDHRTYLRNRPASEVLLGTGVNVYWPKEFERGGYHSVVCGGHDNWPKIHEWCCNEFGKDHYTWSGSRFWFETEQDAILFALKWA